MWIVFGTDVKTRRVPGGARVDRECGQCGEPATFYEKEVTATFRLYFIDIFDYRRHRVMACGCCGACYATDELGLPASQAGEADALGSLGDRAARAARGMGGYIDRAADALEAGVSNLLSSERPASRVATPKEQVPAGDEELDGDAGIAGSEARFRVLEKKAGVRIKID